MKSGNPARPRKDTTMTALTPTLRPLLPMALGLLLAGAGAGCELGTRGEGAMKSETRQVAAFSRIETSAGIDVSVTFDPTPSLEVHAQANLLPLIVAEVKDDTLHLRTTQPYTTTEKVEVVLTTPSLTRVVLSGGSHGQITDLQAEAMELELSGGSRLDATGKATNLTLGMSGGSAAGLQDLETRTINSMPAAVPTRRFAPRLRSADPRPAAPASPSSAMPRCRSTFPATRTLALGNGAPVEMTADPNRRSRSLDKQVAWVAAHPAAARAMSDASRISTLAMATTFALGVFVTWPATGSAAAPSPCRIGCRPTSPRR